MKKNIINILTFGLANFFGKKVANNKNSKKNIELKNNLKVISDSDLNKVILALGTKKNILSVNYTLNTLSIKFIDKEKINLIELKKIFKKGLNLSANNLLIFSGFNNREIAGKIKND